MIKTLNSIFDLMKMLYISKKIENNPKKSRRDIEKTANRKIRDIVKFAYYNSEFYRELYDRAGIDINNFKLKDLPIINKKMLMENFDRVLTVKDIDINQIKKIIEKQEENLKVCKDKYYLLATAGTSGYNGWFVWDRDYMVTTTAFAKARTPVKINYLKMILKGYKSVGLFTCNPMHLSTRSFSMGVIHFFKMRIVPIHQDINTIVADLNKFKPDFLTGFPSIIFNLAKIKQKNKLRIKPENIVTGGEFLSKKVREYIEDVFRTKVYDVYGCTEAHPISNMCKEQEHHINEDFCLVEIVDKKLKSVQENKVGCYILLTNFYSKTFPIIRYMIDDRILIKKKKCKCGSNMKVIDIKDGRTSTMFVFKNKRAEKILIHPFVFSTMLELMHDIVQKQIIQETEDWLIVNVIKKERSSKIKIKNKIIEGFEKIFEKHNIDPRKIQLDILFVDKVYRDKKTGKVQEEISKIYKI